VFDVLERIQNFEFPFNVNTQTTTAVIKKFKFWNLVTIKNAKLKFENL
jgi:hypothetical protein